MKRIASIFLTVLLAFALSGCFLLEPSTSRKKLTTYFDDNAEVVAARVFAAPERGEDEYYFQEVDPEDLDALVAEIDATPLKSHFGHTDYFYKGSYGIELTLADGTYLIYDCTRLDHSAKPFDPEDRRGDPDDNEYLEDTNKDFWDRIEKYFPGMEDHNFSYGW